MSYDEFEEPYYETEPEEIERNEIFLAAYSDLFANLQRQAAEEYQKELNVRNNMMEVTRIQKYLIYRDKMEVHSVTY
ncbi:hypothetical protein AALF16_16970 [Bacillus cereus]